MISIFRKLSQAGVVGINERNVSYVSLVNDARLMPRVNDKVATKDIAKSADVPTPQLFGVVEVNARVRRFHELLDGRESFVIKPAKGSQGNGIVVIAGRTNGKWRTASGRLVSDDQLQGHMSNIISGMYSLGLGDVAMLEEVVTFADTFDDVSSSGVPDIRIIVYYGVPVMAMVRLPSRQSDGKANLHKGGVGLGVDFTTGETTSAVHHNKSVKTHPDTGENLGGIKLPGWEQMLEMASRCYDEIALGYLGVDLVIDANKGPLLLELNARPGLSVQLANQAGLRDRLDKVDADGRGIETAKARVDFAKQAF